MGHIQLSRSADLVVVAPATADILAKMAAGLADDLASTLLLATDKPVLVAPAMNVRMWLHAGDAGQHGDAARARRAGGRARTRARWPATSSAPAGWPSRPRSSPRSRRCFAPPRPLAGKHALVTSGPTHEPIDPVRYIANRSSGRQGHAIAAALAALGARVTLVSGPVGDARSARRDAASRGDGGADAGGLPGGAAGRCRGVRRRGGRLARGQRRRRQDQEAAGRRAAGAGAGAQPRHPGHDRRAPGRSARAWWSASPPRPTT